jgi:hypothetical protein
MQHCAEGHDEATDEPVAAGRIIFQARLHALNTGMGHTA